MPANQPSTDDDIYVNEGNSYENGVYYPGQPEERKAAEAAAVAPIASSLPIMDDVADWFRKGIADCDDLGNIQTAVMTINGVKFSRTVSVEAQVLAYQLLKEKLQTKLTEFEKFGHENTEN